MATKITLLIAEKPDMGRKIASALGANTKRNGYMEGNGIVVSWAVGHLYGLSEPPKYDAKYAKWVMEDLPIIPTKFKLSSARGKTAQINVIKELVKKHKGNLARIVNCADAGREGELIYRYISQSLKFDALKVPQYRLWISSLSPEAIKRGFQNLKPLSHYDNLAQSARLRSEADWLIGMNGSRSFTLKAGDLISVGRVQTPTLAMIYDRQKAIEEFVPTTYYDLFGYFEQEGNRYRGKWQGERVEDKKKAEAIINSTSGKWGKVTSVTATQKKEFAPRLYSLSMLQRDASAKFRFGAKKTLDTLQSLYEKQEMVSYPRTSSQYVTKDEIPMMLGAFKKLQGAYPRWSQNAEMKYVNPNNKLICDESKVTDHHAILPTGKISSSLTPDEKKLYEMILQRFFMQFFGAYVYTLFEAITEVEGEKFKTTAKQPIEWGWKANFSRQEDEEEEVGFHIQKKPAFCVRTTAEERQTQPPKWFTEGTLVTALKTAGNTLDVDADDENKELKEILNTTEGIGTEATRAGIIETLKHRQYIAVEQGKVKVTDKGRQIVEIIRKTPLHILTSPTLTAKWEKALNLVAEGKMSATKFEEQIRVFTNHVVKVVKEQEMTLTVTGTRTSSRPKRKNTKKSTARATTKRTTTKRTTTKKTTTKSKTATAKRNTRK